MEKIVKKKLGIKLEYNLIFLVSPLHLMKNFYFFLVVFLLSCLSVSRGEFDAILLFQCCKMCDKSPLVLESAITVYNIYIYVFLNMRISGYF